MENRSYNDRNRSVSLRDQKREDKQQQMKSAEVRSMKATRAMKTFLEQRKCLPVRGDDDDMRRQSAIHILETILTEWASSIMGNTKGSRWQRPRVSLVTFGSYRLRVHRPESDLDVLAVTPPTCSREQFFSGLVEVLRRDSRISNVHAISSAFTVSDSLVMTVLVVWMLSRSSEPLRSGNACSCPVRLTHHCSGKKSACDQASAK